jgi:hypothetical protein
MQQLYRMLAAALGWFALGLPYVLIVRYKTDDDPLLERIFLNLVGLIVVFAGLGFLLVGWITCLAAAKGRLRAPAAPSKETR